MHLPSLSSFSHNAAAGSTDATSTAASGSRSSSTRADQLKHCLSARQRRFTVHSTSEVKPARPLPTGLGGAFRAWLEMGEKEAARSELRILRRMPYFRLPHEPDPDPSTDASFNPAVVARQYRLEVLPGILINALEIRRARPSTSAPPAPEDDRESGEATVFAHGYGCGAMHFWRQFDTMADITSRTGERTFFLDWHGKGRSTRTSPKVFAPMRRMDEKAGVDAAEDFFLDPLLAFFEKKRITKAHLIGHSLGGYLMAAFALRYPHLVKSLMLLSPAGIPSLPATPSTPPPTPNRRSSQPKETANPSVSAPVSPPTDNTNGGIDGRRLQQALIHTASHEPAEPSDIAARQASALVLQGGVRSRSAERGAVQDQNQDNWDSPSAAKQFEAAVQAGALPDEGGQLKSDPLAEVEEEEEGDESEDEGRKPQTFKGPLGNGKAMQKLYAFMWESGYSPLGFLRKAGPIGPLMLGKYSNGRFSGLKPDEQAELNSYLSNITLLPGSGEYAIGILLRPGAFARFPIVERIHMLPKDVPVRVLYGELDWMDVHGGKDAVRALRRAGNRLGEVAITPQAGHHNYLDNAEWMNDYLRKNLLPDADHGDSPPATPLSSGFSTPTSTAPHTSRLSVTQPTELAQAAAPAV